MRKSFSGKQNYLKNKKFFDRLKKAKPSNLDAVFHQLHEETFERINCLDCANCCKTISPIVKQKDIERLAKQFRVKPSAIIENYLLVDEDRDYIMNQTPCPFLGSDNYCSVYDARPDACRGYPHTNQRKMHTILPLTLKNTLHCPAVFELTERLKQVF